MRFVERVCGQLRRVKVTSFGGESSEPAWELHAQNLLINADPKQTASPEPVAGIPGAVLIHNVLGEGECDTLKALIESVGVTAGDSVVEVPKDIRTNDVALVIASEALVEQLSSRLEPHVPIAGHNGAMANALDRKLSQPPVALLSIC
jgi:hypothetical protein